MRIRTGFPTRWRVSIARTRTIRIQTRTARPTARRWGAGIIRTGKGNSSISVSATGEAPWTRDEYAVRPFRVAEYGWRPSRGRGVGRAADDPHGGDRGRGRRG